MEQNGSSKGSPASEEESSQEEEPEVDEEDSARELERMLSASGYGLFHVLLLLIACLPSAMAAVEVIGVAFVMPVAEEDLKLSTARKGYLDASVFIGKWQDSENSSSCCQTDYYKGLGIRTLAICIYVPGTHTADFQFGSVDHSQVWGTYDVVPHFMAHTNIPGHAPWMFEVGSTKDVSTLQRWGKALCRGRNAGGY